MSLRVALAAVLASVLGLAAAAASAQLYRWTDEKGRVHITDTPPPSSARNVQRKGTDVRPGVAAQAPFELTQAAKNFPVTLYTSPSCKAPCADARTTLNKRGVPFKEVQVWNDETNAELKRVSGATDVPTLVVGRSVQVGYEAGAFNALLDAARYPKAGAVPTRAQAAPEAPEGYEAKGAPPRAEPEAKAEAEAETEAQTPTSGPYAPKPPRER
jgi:glutaredoxin